MISLSENWLIACPIWVIVPDMSALPTNAIDSLEVGIRTYLEKPYPTSTKHAIRNIFHAVELLLKERLVRAHPLLIYKNIDSTITDNSSTVGLDEMFSRFRNLNIDLKKRTLRSCATCAPNGFQELARKIGFPF